MSRHVVRFGVVLGVSSLALCGAESCFAPGSLEHEERFRLHIDASSHGGDVASAPSGGCEQACAIFHTNCAASGCHAADNPAAHLDLASPGIVARLRGAPAQSGACQGQTLLVAGDATKSVVYTKLLAQPSCGLRMPLAGTPLTDDQIDCVRRWAFSPSCADAPPDASPGTGGGASNSGGASNGGGASNSGGMNGTGSTTTDAAMPAPPIYVEAESASLTAPLAIAMDGAASGGKYISAPNAPKQADSTTLSMGIASFTVNVVASGAYVVYGRVEAQDQNSDSYWVKMDGGPWIQWNNLSPNTSWTWVAVHDSDDKDAIVHFDLHTGNHVLLVAYREPNARLDELAFSNDPAFTPAGSGQ